MMVCARQAGEGGASRQTNTARGGPMSDRGGKSSQNRASPAAQGSGAPAPPGLRAPAPAPAPSHRPWAMCAPPTPPAAATACSRAAGAPHRMGRSTPQQNAAAAARTMRISSICALRVIFSLVSASVM